MSHNEFDANRYLALAARTPRIVHRTKQPAIKPWPLSARLFWVSVFVLALSALYFVL